MVFEDKDKATTGMFRRGLRDSGGACPEPEILAAYFERSLSPDETARYDLHFSQCARCREQLAAMDRAGELAATGAAKPQQSSPWSWLWDWRLLAPAAAVLVLAAVWIARRPAPAQVSDRQTQDPLVAMSGPPQQTVPQPTQELSSKLVAPAADASRATGNAAIPAGTPSLARPASPPPAEPPARTVNGESVQNFPLAGRNYIAPEDLAKSAGPPAQKTESADRAENAVVPRSTTQSVTVESAAPTLVPATSSARASAAPTPTPTNGEMAGGLVSGAAGVPQQSSEAKQMKAPAVMSQYRAQAQSVAALGAKERPVEQSLQLIRTGDQKILWRIVSGGFVERSEDGGATWYGQLPDANANLVAGSAPDRKVCWLVGDAGVILLTRNAAHWQTIRPPVRANFMAITAQDASSATVTTADGRKFTTTDRGKTWTPAP